VIALQPTAIAQRTAWNSGTNGGAENKRPDIEGPVYDAVCKAQDP